MGRKQVKHFFVFNLNRPCAVEKKIVDATSLKLEENEKFFFIVSREEIECTFFSMSIIFQRETEGKIKEKKKEKKTKVDGILYVYICFSKQCE